MNKIRWTEFLALKEIKHGADVTIGDIVYVDDGDNFNYGDKMFEKAVVYGYCGDDMYAKVEETGRKISFRFRGDLYKIVGVELLPNSGKNPERSVATGAEKRTKS